MLGSAGVVVPLLLVALIEPSPTEVEEMLPPSDELSPSLSLSPPSSAVALTDLPPGSHAATHATIATTIRIDRFMFMFMFMFMSNLPVVVL